MTDFITPGHDDFLIVVDPQNDFCPGGALAVPDGDQVIGVINRIAPMFANVGLTQDWHPAGHLSFASAHKGREPGQTITLGYGDQMLWPNHCVQGTAGAEFHSDLDLPEAQVVIRKGFRHGVDSYSAFFENDRHTPTGLTGYLRQRGIKRVFVCGLALDFCVHYTALDAVAEDFDTVVIEDACKGIDVNGSLAVAMGSMQAAGVVLIQSRQISEASEEFADPHKRL